MIFRSGKLTVFDNYPRHWWLRRLRHTTFFKDQPIVVGNPAAPAD